MKKDAKYVMIGACLISLVGIAFFVISIFLFYGKKKADGMDAVLRMNVKNGGYTIEYSPENEIEIRKDASLKLVVTGKPSGTDAPSYKITSEDESVLAVNGNNVVAVGEGKTNLKVETTDVSGYSALFTVDVQHAGWNQIGDHWYFITAGNGKTIGWRSIGEDKYYFNEEGIMVSGWQVIDGKMYYFKTKGTKAVMVSGKQVIDGEEYVFGYDGVLQ